MFLTSVFWEVRRVMHVRVEGRGFHGIAVYRVYPVGNLRGWHFSEAVGSGPVDRMYETDSPFWGLTLLI